MKPEKHLSKLEILARLATVREGPYLRIALQAWHDAGYGPVPYWALDAAMKSCPPTLAEWRRMLDAADREPDAS